MVLIYLIPFEEEHKNSSSTTTEIILNSKIVKTSFYEDTYTFVCPIYSYFVYI
jgi:hypothetical protein